MGEHSKNLSKLKPHLANYYEKGVIEAGCDEAGRGCLAGPVTAAAVILPARFNEPLLNDSKKISEKQRLYLEPIIKKKAIAWAIAMVSPAEIDEINILNASFLAMHRAIEKLKTAPESLLIDGNRFNAYLSIPHHCMIKGDGRFKSIAAASVLAKTHRDAYMQEMDVKYPGYGWLQNKGYPTKQHRAAIMKQGTSAIHRQTFRQLANQTKLFSK